MPEHDDRLDEHAQGNEYIQQQQQQQQQKKLLLFSLDLDVNELGKINFNHDHIWLSQFNPFSYRAVCDDGGCERGYIYITYIHIYAYIYIYT